MEYLTTFDKIPDDHPAECGRCGWSGFGRDLTLEVFKQVVEVNCPKCDGRVQLLALPTKQDCVDAAARGNPEAQRMLGTFKREPK